MPKAGCASVLALKFGLRIKVLATVLLLLLAGRCALAQISTPNCVNSPDLKSTNDLRILRNHLRGLLNEGKVGEAEDELKAFGTAHSEDAENIDLEGEIQFVSGNVEKALQDFNRAFAMAPCNPWAHFDAARIFALSGQNESEKRELERAQELGANHQQLLRDTEQLLQSINLLPTGDSRRDTCSLTRGPHFATIPFSVTMDDLRWNHSASLAVEINGVRTRLMIDTGGGGINITKPLAKTTKLKEESSGTATAGVSSATFTVASSHAAELKIGEFTFSHCPVSIDEQSSDAFGGIGLNLFSDYLVVVDFPAGVIRLSPLPDPPTCDAEKGKKQLEDCARGIRDGITPASLQSWSRVLIDPTGGTLLIATRIDNTAPRFLTLDTGSPTMLAPWAVQGVTKLREDRDATVAGFGGSAAKAPHVYRTGTVNFRVGNFSQMQDNVIVIDPPFHSGFTGIRSAGWLGYDFARPLIVGIDYRDHLLYLGTTLPCVSKQADKCK